MAAAGTRRRHWLSRDEVATVSRIAAMTGRTAAQIRHSIERNSMARAQFAMAVMLATGH